MKEEKNHLGGITVAKTNKESIENTGGITRVVLPNENGGITANLIGAEGVITQTRAEKQVIEAVIFDNGKGLRPCEEAIVLRNRGFIDHRNHRVILPHPNTATVS